MKSRLIRRKRDPAPGDFKSPVEVAAVLVLIEVLMISCSLLLLLALQSQTGKAPKPAPVTLSRIFKAHELIDYAVDSHMHLEIRGGEIQTWFPTDIDLTYGSSTEVTELKPGGVAVVRYKRPNMTQTIGESLLGPAKTEPINVNLDYSVTLSPINEILDEKNLAAEHLLFSSVGVSSKRQDSDMGRFISEVHMLARNLGPLDSSLDFAPKLSVDDVAPGDTWKHTLGFSPQTLPNQKGKTAVHRLDYTYTYQGIVDSGGKKVYRVTADLNTNANLADFYYQATGEDPSSGPLKSLPLNMKSHIDFDLDIKTCETIKAVSTSEGGFSVVLNADPSQPAEEEKFKSTTIMLLRARK